MLRSHICTLAVTTSVSILFTVASGCHTTHVHGSTSPSPDPSYQHVPEPQSPAHEYHHKFVYVHYPSCNVYHDRERKLWFWIEGHDWKMGVELPARFHVVEHEAVTVELETESPCEAKPSAPPQPIVDHGPPSNAPAHGYRRKFNYVHYPSCNVYRDRERNLWFWYEADKWHKSVQLPTRIHVDNLEAVRVQLDDDTPYEHGRSGMDANHGKDKGDKEKGEDNGKGKDKDKDR